MKTCLSSKRVCVCVRRCFFRGICVGMWLSAFACLCMHVHNCVWMPLMDKTKDGVRGRVLTQPLRPERQCCHPAHTLSSLLTPPAPSPSCLPPPIPLVKDMQLTQPKGTNTQSGQVSGRQILTALHHCLFNLSHRQSRPHTFTRTVLTPREENKVKVQMKVQVW